MTSHNGDLIVKYEYVFLDMDGVLADFMGGAHKAHGREYDVATYPKGCWEIADHWQMPVDEFWAGIHAVRYFWELLDFYPWMNELLTLAAEHGSEVKLLTSPARSPFCYSGKRAWCDQFIPKGIELIICKSKHLIAGPNRLLIDDGDHNVDPWRKHGGQAILFPQPWNDYWHMADDPMAHVRRNLAPHAGPKL
jgi:hypothetical protein